MLIDNRYADNKMYRAIKHYDSMPLTSGDLHEQFDTEYMKNAYIMDNILGYGTLNTPIISTKSGIRLSEPSVVMIEGDVALIQSDNDTPLVSEESIASAGYPEGIVCILGWYQHISVMNKLRNYGGIDNSEIPNDLMDDRFPTAISSRFQLRWFPIIINKSDYLSGYLEIEIDDRDKDGDKLGTKSLIKSKGIKDSVILFDKPDSMTYAESDLYLVPIVDYEYSTKVDVANAHKRLSAGSQFIVSKTEPEGSFYDGTTWFNPNTREFKTYVNVSGGFVSSASQMAFLQYQSTYTIEEATIAPSDVVVPIGIPSFQEGDILRVIYEGLELAKDLHYTVNYDDATVTLLDFTTNLGDVIYFTVTSSVEAHDLTNITEAFVMHMGSTGSSTLEAHVRLSDTLSDLDSTRGVAATPKMVKGVKSELVERIDNTEDFIREVANSLYEVLTEDINESTKIKDDTTGTKYRLGIDNGLVYFEEVE